VSLDEFRALDVYTKAGERSQMGTSTNKPTPKHLDTRAQALLCIVFVATLTCKVVSFHACAHADLSPHNWCPTSMIDSAGVMLKSKAASRKGFNWSVQPSCDAALHQEHRLLSWREEP